MRLVPLGSGSSGNATLIELEGLRLLVDAGLSARQLDLRLRQLGVEPQRVDCILLSHEHHDHAHGVERFSSRHRIPVACSGQTLAALNLSRVHLGGWESFPSGGRLDLGRVQVESFAVPHDAADPVGFVLHGEGLRIGIVTDLGHATALVRERLRGCEVLMVEANHDDAMLRDGPYPWHLKQRVGGRMGHLSNDEAATLLRATVASSCRAVVLAHLSEKNNTRTLASRAASAALQAAGGRRFELRVAAARAVTPGVSL